MLPIRIVASTAGGAGGQAQEGAGSSAPAGVLGAGFGPVLSSTLGRPAGQPPGEADGSPTGGGVAALLGVPAEKAPAAPSVFPDGLTCLHAEPGEAEAEGPALDSARAGQDGPSAGALPGMGAGAAPSGAVVNSGAQGVPQKTEIETIKAPGVATGEPLADMAAKGKAPASTPQNPPVQGPPVTDGTGQSGQPGGKTNAPPAPETLGAAGQKGPEGPDGKAPAGGGGQPGDARAAFRTNTGISASGRAAGQSGSRAGAGQQVSAPRPEGPAQAVSKAQDSPGPGGQGGARAATGHRVSGEGPAAAGLDSENIRQAARETGSPFRPVPQTAERPESLRENKGDGQGPQMKAGHERQRPRPEAAPPREFPHPAAEAARPGHVASGKWNAQVRPAQEAAPEGSLRKDAQDAVRLEPVHEGGLARAAEPASGHGRQEAPASARNAAEAPRLLRLDDGSSFVVTRRGPASVEVSLRPEGMGKLDIEVNVERGVIHAHINASDPTGKETIERNLHNILSALSKEGFNLGGFSVALRDRRGGGTGHHDGPGGRVSAENAPGTEPVEAASRVSPSPSGTGKISVFA